MYGWRWFLVALGSALAAMVVTGLTVVLPFGWATLVIVAGVLTFLAVLIRYPGFWHRRVAASIIGVWLAASVTAGLSAAVRFDGNSLGYFLFSNLHWSFHLAVCVLILALLYLDYRSTASVVRSVAADQARCVKSTKESLIRAAPFGERGTLTLQALQEESQFYYIDTNKLTREQRYRLAQGQIRARRWTIFAAVVVVVAVVAGFTAVLVLTHDDREAGRKLEEMLRIRDELQRRLSEASAKNGDLMQIVKAFGVTSAWAESLAVNDDGVSELAESLKELYGRFERQYGEVSLSRDHALQLRLIKATLDNSAGQYADTLRLITADDAASAIDNAVRAYEVRGDAFFGLRRWEKALACYAWIIKVNPHHWYAELAAANCHIKLGAYTDSLTLLNRLANRFNAPTDLQSRMVLGLAVNARGVLRRLNHQFTASLNDLNLAVSLFGRLAKENTDYRLRLLLAYSLNNRGNALSGNGDYDASLEDYRKAARILGTSANEIKRVDETLGMAVCIGNRGNTYRLMRQLQIAEKDLTTAAEIYEILINAEGRAELSEGLADILRSRAIVYRMQQRYDDALNDVDYAVELHGYVADMARRKPVSRELAGCLSNRGITLRMQHRYENAVADFSEAVRIYNGLVDRGGLADVSADLAACLSNRGIALRKLRRYAEASGDTTEAITIYRNLTRDSTAPELLNALGAALNNRGTVMHAVANYSEALKDYDESIRIRAELVKSGRSEFAHDLAVVLNNRGGTRVVLMRLAVALKDFTDAATIFRQLSEGDETRQVAPELIVCLTNLGGCLHRQGEYSDALDALDRAMCLINEHTAGQTNMRAQRAISLNVRGTILSSIGRFPEAKGHFSDSIRILRGLRRNLGKSEIDIELASCLNNLAWLYSTCPRAEIRNGKAALELAEEASNLGRTDSIFLDTLAAAYAESGNFEKAMEMASLALNGARDCDRDAFRSRFDLYRRGRPYRTRVLRSE